MWVHGWRKAGSGGQINENSKCITLGDFFSFIFEPQYFKTVSGFGNRRILTLSV